MNQTVEPLHFTVPLSFEAHAIARAALQSQLPQTEQTYLKALAVYAVDYYLRCLGIATDPTQSDWCDPWMAKLINVADLWVKPHGKIECCYLLPGDTLLSISPDAWADRIGYMAVQFTATLQEATLLGFTPSPVTELSLSDLRSLDQFLDYLPSLQQDRITQSVQSVQSVRSVQSQTENISELDPVISDNTTLGGAPSGGIMETDRSSHPNINQTIHQTMNSTIRQTIHLRRWLEGVIEAGWQKIETSEADRLAVVRGPSQFEITVRQAKLIDVGMDLGEQSVVLSLAITVNPDTSMNVLVQTHPAAGQSYLPPNLTLTMLSETGDRLQEVCAREQDSYIQLRHFRGEAGDSFDIQVSLDHIRVLESFVL